ncbi:hypothetical protein E8E11_003752 [Didymella keratinophila]|nr:hypothetical protein E8E11_003752 [Didymella keratinophila]
MSPSAFQSNRKLQHFGPISPAPSVVFKIADTLKPTACPFIHTIVKFPLPCSEWSVLESAVKSEDFQTIEHHFDTQPAAEDDIEEDAAIDGGFSLSVCNGLGGDASDCSGNRSRDESTSRIGER